MNCLEYELCSSDVIQLTKSQYKGVEEYTHFCKLDAEDYESKECTIHFNQNERVCKYHYRHHPCQYDVVTEEAYQTNMSCGYILMKV